MRLPEEQHHEHQCPEDLREDRGPGRAFDPHLRDSVSTENEHVVQDNVDAGGN